jgi:hypothetical protein
MDLQSAIDPKALSRVNMQVADSTKLDMEISGWSHRCEFG